MTAPRSDQPGNPGDEGRPTGTETCPRCGAKRLGAFRSCVSCGFDFEAPKAPVYGPPPEDQSPPPVQPRLPPTPAPAATPPAAPTAASAVTPAPTAAPAATATPTLARTSAAARPSLTTGRTALTIGPRGKRLAVGASAVLLVVAVAIVLLAKGIASPNPSPQASQGPTFTAIPPEGVSSACATQLGPLVAALESLDSSANSETSFSDYSQKLSSVKAARGKVNVTQFDPTCVAIYAAAQSVISEHMAAFSTWDYCNHATNCTRQSIDSALQKYWSGATKEFAEIKASMPQQGPTPIPSRVSATP
jgi:hypothetical protein